MNARVLLPYDRPMNADELRGFRMGMACLKTFGTQLVAASVATGGAPQPMQMVRLQESRARFLVDIAEALDLTIGQNRHLRADRRG